MNEDLEDAIMHIFANEIFVRMGLLAPWSVLFIMGATNYLAAVFALFFTVLYIVTYFTFIDAYYNFARAWPDIARAFVTDYLIYLVFILIEGVLAIVFPLLIAYFFYEESLVATLFIELYPAALIVVLSILFTAFLYYDGKLYPPFPEADKNDTA